MSAERQMTAEEIARAIEAARSRVEEERRARFEEFGITRDCLWPASRLFHDQSSLGPAWTPALSVEEVEALTRDLTYRRYPGADRTVLPRCSPIKAELEQTIRERRSISEFGKRPLSLPQLAKLLELGSGVTETGEIPRRAAPSGGALYPIETYALALAIEGLASGVYHYLPLDHALEHLRPASGIEVAAPAFPPTLLAGRPPLILALAVIFARTQQKYRERGYRFALLEAGHIAQNIVLTAAALGLGAVCVGGFWDEPFNSILGLEPSEEAAVYSVFVGVPEGASSSRG
jgi:SagB-type dehydrogenase family enzyme